jgi:SAM-dependent methyltransferase
VTLLFVVATLLRFFDAVRGRARLRSLPVAGPVSADAVADDDGWIAWLAPGVTLTVEGRRAAIAHARAGGHELLDLSPAIQAAHCVLLFAATKGGPEPKKPFAPFRGAGYAILASRTLVEQSGRAWSAPVDAAAVITLAERLGRYASARPSWAVVPGLEAPAAGHPGDGAAARLALWTRLFSGVTPVAILFIFAMHVLGLYAPWEHLVSGLVLLVGLHLHGPIVLAGAPVKARDLVVFTLLRTLIEVGTTLRFALAWRPGVEPAAVTARRPAYQNPGRLQEDRRTDCPLCGGADLTTFQVSRDLIQHKPGRFVLDRCRGCDHIFQNPRLSPAGFAYYYGDAYDGLAEDLTELAFGAIEPNYQQRAAAVEGLIAPTRWLDVGGGHGHFCASARRRFPGARFEGLDLSESIEDAERRGWIDRAYRGLFPDVAPALRRGERFDVVSMSHYLEHTIDPIAEIRSANLVLADGGVLMVEVPDPASRIGRTFRTLWVPWLQPQHLHFVSIENLGRILAASGFEVVRTHRGEAHMFGDFLGIGWRLSKWLAPPTHVPWRPRVGAARALWRVLVRTALLPVMAVGMLLDLILAPLLKRPGWSNTYRVVARKTRDLEAAEPAPMRASA